MALNLAHIAINQCFLHSRSRLTFDIAAIHQAAVHAAIVPVSFVFRVGLVLPKLATADACAGVELISCRRNPWQKRCMPSQRIGDRPAYMPSACSCTS